MGAGSFTYKHQRWQEGQMCDGSGPGHSQFVVPAAEGDKTHTAPSIPACAVTRQHPNPPSSIETSHLLLCFTAGLKIIS